MKRALPFFLRVALGATFLSAVAGRLGLWDARDLSTAFRGFVAYTGELNPWAPPRLVPVLAMTATALETTFGLALVTGLHTRAAAIGGGALLLVFAVTMSLFTGPKSALDYSVWSAAAGAFVLATVEDGGRGGIDGWRARATAGR
jgi:uncharacterized membrane protein YphA (DoxX/SURF4 family)